MITEFATAEQIATYNQAIGAPSILTMVLGVPRFTALQVTQANLRANNHIRIQYFDDLQDEFKLNKDGSGNIATTLDELRDDVRAAFQEAVSKAAALELISPDFFASNVNLATDVQVAAVEGIKFFERKHASTTVQVDATRGQANDINRLLNPYTKTELINPTSIDPATGGTPTTARSRGLGLFVGKFNG